MAQLSSKHQFVAKVEMKPVNPVYEVRPYITGSFFLGFGGITTTYKKEMVSYDALEEVWMCQRCGEPQEHPDHNIDLDPTRP